MRGKIILLLGLVALSGCVPPPQAQLLKETPSGYPEAVFKDDDTVTIRGKIIQGCIKWGMMVEESTENQVVCSSSIEDTSAKIGTLMFTGSAYSAAREKTRFSFYKEGSGVNVVAQPTIELQVGGGAIRSSEVKSISKRNDAQYFLYTLGGD